MAIELDRKKIRKICPHYQSGGWCRFGYNTATDLERSDFDEARKNNKPIENWEELIVTCHPENCSIWFEDIYNKQMEKLEGKNKNA